MSDLSACMLMHNMHSVLCQPEEGVRYPGSGDADSCEPQCRFWELNMDLLKEHQVLLTNGPSL